MKNGILDAHYTPQTVASYLLRLSDVTVYCKAGSTALSMNIAEGDSPLRLIGPPSHMSFTNISNCL